MGKVIPFPVARVRRRQRRRAEMFGRHFELLHRAVIWDRLTLAGVALVALVAVI